MGDRSGVVVQRVAVSIANTEHLKTLVAISVNQGRSERKLITRVEMDFRWTPGWPAIDKASIAITAEITRLRPGDLFLLDARSATRVHVMVRSMVLFTADRSGFCSRSVYPIANGRAKRFWASRRPRKDSRLCLHRSIAEPPRRTRSRATMRIHDFCWHRIINAPMPPPRVVDRAIDSRRWLHFLNR